MTDLPTSLKTKIGRKGDPRMYQAVTAKLNDPDISLLDALLTGGFEFPNLDQNDKSSKYSLKDKDGVLLGQRKNQLSRRLREAKNQIETTASSAERDTKDSSSHNSESSKKSSVKRKNDGETNEVDEVPSNISANTSLKQSKQNDTQIPKGKANDECSSLGSHASLFSGKLKDFDSFSFLTMLKPTDVISCLGSSRKSMTMIQDTKSEIEANSILHNPSLISPESSDQDVIGLNQSLQRSINPCKNNQYHDPDENESDNLHRRNSENEPFLKNAMNLLHADIKIYMKRIMTKAGYPDSDTSEHSIEYLTFFANAINAQVDIIQDLKNKTTVSDSHTEPSKTSTKNLDNSLLKSALDFNNLQSKDMNHIENSRSDCVSERNKTINALLSNMSSQVIPLKKRRLQNNLNDSYQKIVSDEC